MFSSCLEVSNAALKIAHVVDACLEGISAPHHSTSLGGKLTCKIASLCISTPLQDGMRSFRTPNSSFILLLLLRSMILCAVFLATLRPAAVLAVAVLRLPPALAGFEDFVAFPGGTYAASSSLPPSCACDAGCILLRERDGGGGREKSEGSLPPEECLEALTDSGEANACGETSLRGGAPWPATAEGGSWNCESSCGRLSACMPLISVEGAGVGGKVAGGMLAARELLLLLLRMLQSFHE